MTVYVLVMAALLGLTTWIPLSAGHHPQRAMIETPLFLFTLALPAGLAIWIAERDPWLGAFVGYAVLRALTPPSASALQIALWIACGAAGVVLMQRADARVIRYATGLLVVLGAIQVVLASMQAFGWDPLYPGTVKVHGTLESPKILAGTLALIGAIAPWVWALLMGAAILSLTAFLPALALAVALLVRYRGTTRMAWIAAPVLVLGTLLVRGSLMDSLSQRAMVWGAAVRDLDHSWPALLFGRGFGSWAERIPGLQLALQPGSQDVYFWSYSEPIQLLYEGGCVALALVVGWLYWHRAMWTRPWAGGAAALGVLSLGQFPMHLATSAGLSVLVLGLATRRDG